MGESFQFLDIILFAMIAAFLILRLRSVLGRRNDRHPPSSDPFQPEPHKPPSDDKVIPLPGQVANAPEDQAAEPEHDGSALSAGLNQIRAAAGDFEVEEFLVGARTAFEMVLRAFAEGDTETLKTLLATDVYENFFRAVREREMAGETLQNTLVGIRNAELIEAYMEGRNALLTVKIESEQVNATVDEAGSVVSGDQNHIAQITDIWTFVRDTASRDPNWQLSATRSLD